MNSWSVAGAFAVNLNGNNTLLANGASAIFINGKHAVINDLKKMKKALFWLILLLVVPFNKIPLFYKYLITFIISDT